MEEQNIDYVVIEKIEDDIKENLATMDNNERLLIDDHVQNIDWEKIANYDTVLVKMNESDKWYNQSGHELRPFIIKKKNDVQKKVNGYYLTCNLNNIYFNGKKSDIKVVLSKNDYKLKKDSLILFQRSIKMPYEQIIFYIDHLKDDDLAKLQKSLSILHGHYVEPEMKVKSKVCEYGDLVLFEDEKYIIYAVDNILCYGYLIEEVGNDTVMLENDLNIIQYKNKIYNIYFDKYIILNAKEIFSIVDRFDMNTVDLIRKNKKEIKYLKKKKGKKSR